MNYDPAADGPFDAQMNAQMDVQADTPSDTCPPARLETALADLTASLGNSIQLIQTSPDEIALGERFQQVLEGLGYAHYIYSHIDANRERLYMIQCTYPDNVRRFWADERVCTRDPLIPHLIRSVTPSFRTDVNDDGSWAEGVFEAVHSAGIAAPAWHMPIRDGTNYIGLFSISARIDEMKKRGDDHYTLAALILPALCLEAHETWVRLTASPAGPVPKLKDQEIETLNWLSHGKSTEDIAQIMGITERTVNYHVMRIKEKLGVETRAHAVANAMRAGII